MNQSMRGFRLETYLNSTGEQFPGGNVAVFNGGFLGQEFFLSDAEAAANTNPSGTITQLRNGYYQRVLSKAGSTAAPAAGVAAYWDGSLDNFGNYVVTPDNNNGIRVGHYLAAVTKGYYCFIQTSGVVHVLFGTLTKAGAAIGDVVSNIAASGKGDVLADATTITHASMQNVMGRALEAPANDTIKKVWIPRSFLVV